MSSPIVNVRKVQRDDWIARKGQDLTDQIYEMFLGEATAQVYEDMQSYYSLTELEIDEAITRVGKNDSPSTQDKLIEQEFINSQVWYMNQIVQAAMKGL